MLKNSLWLFCSTGALSPTVLWRKTSLCLEAHSSAGLKAPLDPHLSGTSWTGEESWTTVLCCRTSRCESSQPHTAKYKWLCVSQAPGMFFLNTFLSICWITDTDVLYLGWNQTISQNYTLDMRWSFFCTYLKQVW